MLKRSGRVLVPLAVVAWSIGCGGDPASTPGNSPTPFPTPTPAPAVMPTDQISCETGRFWYHWSCCAQTLLTTWGFGRQETAYFHNDRRHAWYIDQANTGPAAGNNCGPSCAVMAAKWYDESFAGTVEQARDMFPNDGGWWSTRDVLSYLEVKSVPHAVVAFTGTDRIGGLLTEGRIVLLCLSTEYLRRNTAPEERVDKFYGFSSGHFLIVKGVRIVDGETFFEAYDSNNWNAAYSDLSPKGRNRHYRAVDMSQAISNWWGYLVVVLPTATAVREALPGQVDPATIEHAWGR